ncbi:L,D-transpeptidase family protein [Candidatus Peregrinibacteria bacterium]|nr:L,D-transpeptidase family protein [Candidatus Peregrinibacteria bacterium]
MAPERPLNECAQKQGESSRQYEQRRSEILAGTSGACREVSRDVGDARERNPLQPEWNRDITLTFDDSLRNSAGIIEHLDKNGIKNFRFYGESGTAMKVDVLKEMGVDNGKESKKLTPGRWLTEYVDKKRGSLSREEYMRQYMIKSSERDGTNYLANGAKIKERFMRLYPHNWLEKIEETFGYHAAMIHPSPTDTKNHIQYWTVPQIQENIETFETFVRAWLDIPEFNVRHLRTPAGGRFGYDADFRGRWDTGTKNAAKLQSAIEKFRPGATWDMWTTYTADALQHGRIDYGGVAREAIGNMTFPPEKPFLPKDNLLLMHSNYYDEKNFGKIDRLSKELGEAYYKGQPEKRNKYLVHKTATIEVEGAFVRSKPEQGSEAKVITRMPKGAKVFVRERVPGLPAWLKITWGTDESTEGYIHESQLKIDERILPGDIPEFPKMRTQMEAIDSPYRHYFTAADRAFINTTFGEHTAKMDLSRNQYMVVINRAEQFAALVYYSREANKYYIVGDFGSKVSTGKQDVANRTWATPLGLYDRLPIERARAREQRPEWRTEGKGGGGYGPAGSRVFVLGKVDVKSPYGEPLNVALHKTNKKSVLGEVAASHGCVRTYDAFVDILDNNGLIDGDYGRYVLVGDSGNTRYAGDYRQLQKA